MADDKQTRDEQADDEIRRQRERMLREALSRADEDEPIREDTRKLLGDLTDALDTHDYPTTADDLIEAYGNHEIEMQSGTKSLGEVFTTTEDRAYTSADDVRKQIMRLLYESYQS